MKMVYPKDVCNRGADERCDRYICLHFLYLFTQSITSFNVKRN